MKSAFIALTALLLLVLSAPAASAEKPTRGCPDKFILVDAEYMSTVYPDLPGEIGDEIFAFYDKNGDGWLCGKVSHELERKLIYNTVDNTSNH